MQNVELAQKTHAGRLRATSRFQMQNVELAHASRLRATSRFDKGSHDITAQGRTVPHD